MSFRDYSLTPGENTTLDDGTYIGPNMLRNKVRPALQQLAADGRELSDDLETLDARVSAPAFASSLAAAVAALLGSASYAPPGTWGGVDKGQHVTPEMFDALMDPTTQPRRFSAALDAAITLAAATTGIVWISGRTCYYDKAPIIPAGVTLMGTALSQLKRRAEVRVALTSGFSAGSGTKSFVLPSVANLEVGQEGIFVKADGSAASPSDAFNHRNPTITAIDTTTKTVTVNSAASLMATVAGDFFQTAARGPILAGVGAALCNITIDGNYSNQTTYSWLTHTETIIEASWCQLRNVTWQNSPSDATLVASPTNGVYITGSLVDGCRFDNIGGNCVHYGLSERNRVTGCAVNAANKRNTGLNIAHQNGAFIYSNDCRDLTVFGCQVKDALTGVGSIDGSPTVENDKVSVIGCTFIDCRLPIEIAASGKIVIISGNRCEATYPFPTYDANTISVVGVSDTQRPTSIVITNNQMINGNMLVSNAAGVTIVGNNIDNYGMMDPASDAPARATMQWGITAAQVSGATIDGNTINGGGGGILVQNNFVTSDIANKPGSICDNTLCDQKYGGISGVQGSPGSDVRYHVSGNVITNRAAAAGSYVGITREAGMFGIGNRIETVAGATWGGAGNAANWRDNVVNGAWELPPNFTNDGTAATGGVPIGGRYRNGSVLMVRVA